MAATASWQYSASQAEVATDQVSGSKLVVIDPPSEFGVIATSLGFVVGPEIELAELSIKTVTLSVPAKYTIDAAIATLERHFPDLIIDDGEISS